MLLENKVRELKFMWDETDEGMGKPTLDVCLSPRSNAQNLKSALQKEFRLRAKIVVYGPDNTKIVVMGDIMSIESTPYKCKSKG